MKEANASPYPWGRVSCDRTLVDANLADVDTGRMYPPSGADLDLIRAAPELLEALRQAYMWVYAYGKDEADRLKMHDLLESLAHIKLERKP
jgi:hypothetical protein